MYDPVKRVVAAVHSGWRGITMKVIKKTITMLTRYFRISPSDLMAVIGTSIGPESFSVHDDVINAFEAASFPVNDFCVQKDEDTFFFNLWEANRWLLSESGVKLQNIRVVGICSYISHNEFYSARYEKNNKCGRTINAIKLISLK